MLVVHHLNNSRSHRILWLLEELELPYEIKRYERDRETLLAPPSLRAVHPLGKSPVVTDGADVPYPPATAELHHEVEMVVALAGGGRDIAPSLAETLIFGYGVGLDLTRRDLQAQAKAKGHPWDVAKAFDHSAPVSALCPVEQGRPGPRTQLSLEVNEVLRQQSTLDAMVHDVPSIIAALSKLFELKPGDLIFTGTPAGVAALQRGDRFRAELEGIAVLEGRVA